MNIGIVTTWFERGAAYVSRQYRDILISDNNVFIYARGGESYAIGDPTWDSPQVTWGKKCYNPVPMSVDANDFEDWIQRCNLDLVFFNEQNCWTPVLACRHLGILTGTYIDYYTETTVPFFGCYDFLICNTRKHYSVFKWHPQCYYIPWGTNTDIFTMKSAASVSTGCITFFHSAGVSPSRKGCDLVINAFSQIGGNACLVIHAQQNLKVYYPKLAGLITQLETDGRLKCIEESVSAPGLFHMGDVYVYPTRLEGIGLTILEANACGLPVITTACGPMTEFISNGINGRLVSVENYIARSDGYYWPQAIVNTEDLIIQMRWYIDHADELSNFKREARAYAETHLSWENNAKVIPEIFRNVRRIDKNITEQVASITDIFETKRTNLHKLNYYQLLRLIIQDNYPRIFKFISFSLDFMRKPFKILQGRN